MDRLLAMQVFERVADEAGFSAAARALDMSPPVVTRLIAELEAHLGARLFQRTTRRVSLTDAGEVYLGRVRQILQDVEEAEALVSDQTKRLNGRLRVNTMPVLASYVIAPLLTGFREQYPGIVIDIDANTYRSPPIEDYDLTLLGTDIDFDANFVARKVVESEIILVAAPAYLQRAGTPAQPQDLLQHECLRLRRPEGPLNTWRMWPSPEAKEALEIDIEPVLIANHTDTLLRAALDGAGIAPVSLDIAAAYITRGDLVRVLSPWSTGRVAMYAALPSRKFIPQRTHVFLDYLIAHTRQRNASALQACVACQ